MGESIATPGPAPKARGEKKKEKGKGKEVAVTVPPMAARSVRQQRRQAAVDEARAKAGAQAPTPVREERAPSVAPAVPQTILKRPESGAEGAKKKEEERLASKVAARVRWESGDFSKEEDKAYHGAADLIRALDAANDEQEKAAAAVAHMAGMRAVEDLWEEQQARQQRRVASRPSQQQAPVRAPQQPPQQQQQQQRPEQRQQQQRQVQQQPKPADWAQRAAAAAALPQTGGDYTRGGLKGKAARELTGLEAIKGSVPWDERGIVFERAAGAPQILPTVAAGAAAFVNVALSKVAPPHVRTEGFKISSRGRLSTTARQGASAAMLLRFKKEIIEAARRADNAIINVVANETWAELKILVPYQRYREENGLGELREQIEAENAGVIIPPFSMRWMRSKRVIEEHFRNGKLPQGAASVVFKVPGKEVGKKLLSEMWVAGNKFQALPFIADRADTLCSICSQWGHSEFRCQKGARVCAICAGPHRTEDHRCEVVTCGKTGKVCTHSEMQCPNCGGRHPAQDARCKAKAAAIAIARGGRVRERGSRPARQQGTQRGSSPRRPEAVQTSDTALLEAGQAQPEAGQHTATRPWSQGIDAARSVGTAGPLNWVPGASLARPVAEWAEDEMEISEVETSGAAPPMAV